MKQTALRIGFAALLLGASQLASRGLGVLREMVLAYQVGVGPEADAYRAAFQLPDLLNHFLAMAAVATAFIPLYHRARQRGGEPAARRFFAAVLGTLTPFAVLTCALFFIGADAFIALYFPHFSPEQQALAARLTRIVLPAQVFFVAGGIVRAVLMADGRFGAQAAAPVLYNLGIILGGVLLGGALGVEGFAWGALLGAFFGHLLAPIVAAHGRIPLRMRFAPFDADFLAYLRVALPLLVGVTLVSADEWLDRYFGQFALAGAIALLFYARALLQAPVGLIGQALGTAALPALAQLYEQGRRRELSELLQGALQTGMTLGVFAAAALAALAEPLVQLLYVHGAFSAEDGSATAALLVLFSAGLPAWVMQTVAVRAFYARGDTWRPMLLGSVVVVSAIPLYYVLGRRFGAPGLAAAGSLAISVNACAVMLLARRLHGAPRPWPLLGVFVRSALMALPAATAAWWAAETLTAPGTAAALLSLLAGAALFSALLLPLAARFADAGTRTLLALAARRLRLRARGGE